MSESLNGSEDLRTRYDFRVTRSEVDSTDSLVRYLSDVSEHDLLTAEDEVELAMTMEEGNKALSRLNESNGDLSVKDKRELKQLIEAGDAAKEEFIQSNLRLVINVAKRFRGRGLDLLDLVQEGNTGLIRAVEKFDYRKGFKFSTYATYWIRQSLQRAVANQGTTIRVPAHLVRQATTVLTENGNKTKEAIDDSAIEKAGVEIPLELFQHIIMIIKPDSLDRPVYPDENDSATLRDYIPDTGEGPEIEIEAYDSLRYSLEKYGSDLNEKEMRIMKIRFGYRSNRVLTTKEIAAVLGEDPEKVRASYNSAHAKLKASGQRVKEDEEREKRLLGYN